MEWNFMSLKYTGTITRQVSTQEGDRQSLGGGKVAQVKDENYSTVYKTMRVTFIIL